MEMISVQIKIPRDMASFVRDEDPRRAFERNAMMLYPFIQDMTISHGRAAELLGIHKLDLIDYYDSMGMPYLNQSPSDLDDEIAGFSRLREKRGS